MLNFHTAKLQNKQIVYNAPVPHILQINLHANLLSKTAWRPRHTAMHNLCKIARTVNIAAKLPYSLSQSGKFQNTQMIYMYIFV